MSEKRQYVIAAYLALCGTLAAFLGPFYGAIAVPSVTRCRRRRGHRCVRHLVNGRAAARSGEWAQHFSNASCLHILAKYAYRRFFPHISAFSAALNILCRQQSVMYKLRAYITTKYNTLIN